MRGIDMRTGRPLHTQGARPAFTLFRMRHTRVSAKQGHGASNLFSEKPHTQRRSMG
jgi:hypothetical protein